jgi:prophage antirepressor-like protein
LKRNTKSFRLIKKYKNAEKMITEATIKLFEEKKVRTAWNAEQEEWYFSVVDVVGILTDSPRPRKYWNALKTKLKAEGSELSHNLGQLKLPSDDGKNYLTDVASTEQIFRIIQSIPSPKAEPFKQWLAHIAKERIDQLQDPERSIEQAMTDYKRLGYSDNWINQRLKSIEIRKELTDEWKNHGLQEGVHFSSLTDIIYKTWSEKTAKEYKQFKGLKKENLRDNMTNKELVINMLAELSTKEISEVSNPETMNDHENIARRGGNIARKARLQLEAETGKKVVSPLNAKNVLCIENNP